MLCSPAYASSLYPCDLTDAEWAQLSPLLPSPPRRGRPRCWSLRLLVNALFYILRICCAWRYLPQEYPPWQTAYTTFRQWHLHGVWQRVHEALHHVVRVRAGRDPEPSAAIMDSQSVKTTEESGLIKGYDGGKQVKGRKRHVLVDTLGLLLAVYVTPANTSDQEGARRLLVGPQALATPPGAHLGRQCLSRRRVSHLVCHRRRLACGDHHMRATRPGVCRPTVVLDCGTHAGMDGEAAPLEQGLRTPGTDE